jgi:hypothetical protein
MSMEERAQGRECQGKKWLMEDNKPFIVAKYVLSYTIYIYIV